MKKLNRRKFLKLSGLAAGTSLLAACAPKNAAPASTAMPGMAMGAAPTAAPSANFAPDLEIALKATSGAAQILPGKPTNVWRYAANVVKGDPGAVVTLPEIYIGPIIRAKKG